ncbi:hypothetical protein [Clostridium baratii]|uniref:hypothetical protein n=1 Tax=Clostridium baratii TaxID=1561 RepID=UPI0006BB0212|nr:hypothetical protein [Clostridium baratii]MDU1854094.1 hypothetical protein [Clostridium baratii]
MVALSILEIIVIILIITFFSKALGTFRKIKEDDDDESLKEMNKKGSRYMIVAVILIPIAILIAFRIMAKMFLNI